jgi:hypothetical protein
MNRRTFLRSTSAAVGAVALASQFEQPTLAQTVEGAPTFRSPKVILPVPTPSAQYQKVQPGVPDTQLTREATGLLHEFSTPCFSITPIAPSSGRMNLASSPVNALTWSCCSSALRSMTWGC